MGPIAIVSAVLMRRAYTAQLPSKSRVRSVIPSCIHGPYVLSLTSQARSSRPSHAPELGRDETLEREDRPTTNLGRRPSRLLPLSHGDVVLEADALSTAEEAALEANVIVSRDLFSVQRGIAGGS